MSGEKVFWIGTFLRALRKLTKHLRVLRKIVVVSIFLSLLQFLPSRGYFSEAASNWQGYFLILSFVSLLILGFSRVWKKSIRLILSLIIVFSSILPIKSALPYFTASNNIPSKHSTNQFSVMFMNVNIFNQNLNKVLDLITLKNPDILIIQELSSELQVRLAEKDQYIERVEIPAKDPFGLALYSKFPIISPRSENLLTSVGEGLTLIILANLNIKSMPVSLVSLHPFPPISRKLWRSNKLLTRRVATLLRHKSKNVILASDLNMSIFSKRFKFIKNSLSLRDAMYSYGLKKTWNRLIPLFHFTIDHILYRGDLAVADFEVLDLPGSDHNSLYVTFSPVT